MKTIKLKMTAMQPICQLSEREKIPELSTDERYLKEMTGKSSRSEGRVIIINRVGVVTPRGVVDIPVVSANSSRGIWRRLGARDLLEKLDIKTESISKKMYYLLFSGGGLADKGKSNPFKSVDFKNELRKKIPLLSLFGCSIGVGMLEGKLKPGFIWPVVKETQFMFNDEDNTEKDYVSAKDIIKDIMHTRRDDYAGNENEETEDKKEISQQMIYRNEYISAGTNFVQEIIIMEPTDIEMSCFYSILKKFKEERPYIGGMSAKGFGRVKITELIEGDTQPYYDFLDKNKDEIKAYLKELDKLL